MRKEITLWSFRHIIFSEYLYFEIKVMIIERDMIPDHKILYLNIFLWLDLVCGAHNILIGWTTIFIKFSIIQHFPLPFVIPSYTWTRFHKLTLIFLNPIFTMIWNLYQRYFLSDT